MTDHLTPEELDTIEACCEAATTGGPARPGELYAHVRATIPRLVKAYRASLERENDWCQQVLALLEHIRELGDLKAPKTGKEWYWISNARRMVHKHKKARAGGGELRHDNI